MFKIVLIVVGSIIGLIVVFIIWRIAATVRGMGTRDEKLLQRLDPIANRIQAGEPVSAEEIADLAARPELRFMLFTMLRELKRPDLLPPNYSSSVAQGESGLVYWMMHPNELQDAPETIELVETIKREVNGREADFHVYRYKMAAGHWAAKDGWLLGLSGPMTDGVEPYSERPPAFSRCSDTEGKIKPSELVDWWIGIMRQKGMIQ